jgi:glucosamine-6-phosphate deaminase
MTKKPLVFISSTVKDLRGERNTTASILTTQYEFETFASESEGAKWESSYETCISNLYSSDFVVLILGHRYGYIPKRKAFPFDGRLSVTHGEFALAKQQHKPLLVYIKSLEDYEPKQQRFIDEVKDFYSGYFVSTFENAQELAIRLKTDIPYLLAQLIRSEYKLPEEQSPLIVLCDTTNEVFAFGAKALRWTLTSINTPSFLLSGGNTSAGIFDTFFKEYQKGLIRNATFFTNFEYVGISPSNPLSRQQYFYTQFISRIEQLEAGTLESINSRVSYVPGIIENGTLDGLCLRYDASLKAHKPFLGLLSISPHGEFAGICPDKCKDTNLLSQYTSAIEVSERTASYLKPAPKIPFVVTVGAANLIHNVRNLLIFLTGKVKSGVFKKLLYDKTGFAFPPNALKEHGNLILVIDKDVVSNRIRNYPDDRVINSERVNFETLFS